MKNTHKHLRMAAIGELLWDLLPGGPQLGGAPANYAAMLAQISASTGGRPGDEVFMVSRAGNDALGLEARDQLIAYGVKSAHLTIDPEHATGTVAVVLDKNDAPTYVIHENVAWDYVPETPELAALAPTLDAVCYGTLAQRGAVTRATLRSLVAGTRADCLRVFDVNRRAPDWAAEWVVWGCGQATIVKMNDEEVPYISEALEAPEPSSDAVRVARFLLKKFPVQMVAITRGREGSLMVTREAVHEHPGVRVRVEDTIGAGDCFTAALTYYALLGCPLPELAEAANRWGAWAAAQRGGMHFLDEEMRAQMESAIGAVRN